MSVHGLIKDLRRRDILLSFHDGRIRVNGPPDVLTDELVEQLRQQKPSLMAALRDMDGHEYKVVQRASRLPVEIEAGLMTLRASGPRGNFRPTEWAQIIADTEAFASTWASSAFALGWTAQELFGAHAERGWVRADGGLVVTLRGSTVVMIDAEGAVVVRNGAQVRLARLVHSGAVPLWELEESFGDGPPESGSAER